MSKGMSSLYLTPRVLKGPFIRILEVDTKVESRTKNKVYAVIFSYILMYFKNTMEIFYKSHFMF